MVAIHFYKNSMMVLQEEDGGGVDRNGNINNESSIISTYSPGGGIRSSSSASPLPATTATATYNNNTSSGMNQRIYSLEDVLHTLEQHIADSIPVHELCCCEILTDNDMELLSDFLRQNCIQMNLRSLKLPKNNLTSNSSHAVSRIVQNMNETLLELDLSDNNKLVGGDSGSLMTLVDALTQPTCRVTKLNLDHNKIGPKGAAALGSLLRNNQTIQDLSISNNALGQRTIKTIVVDLCENETLQKLNLSYNKLGDRGANLLAAALDSAVSQLPLRDLDLTYNKIGPAGVFNITKALLEGNKSLRRIDLSLNRIGPEGAECFGVVVKFSHTLEELILSRNNVGDGVMNLLEGLQESDQTNLQLLDLSWNSLTDDAAEMVAKILRGNSVLKSLNLASNAISSRGAIALARSLSYDLALQELDLVGNQADDQSASVLADVLCRPGCKLRTLKCEKNNFSQAGKERLEAAFKFRTNMATWLSGYFQNIEKRRVLSLDFSSKPMGDHEVMALSAQLAKYKPRVTTLWINGKKVTGRGVACLSRDVLATNNAKLERLYMQDTLLGDGGAAALAQAMLTNTTLRVLTVKNCNITAEGARKLANAIRRNQTITRINLSGNKIGDVGVQEILNAVLTDPPHPTLKALNVSLNGVTDRGLKLPSSLSPFGLLEDLHLGHNDITDVGALELAKQLCIASSSQQESSTQTYCLRWLDLSGNRLSSKGVQALRLFRPPSTVLEMDNQFINNRLSVGGKQF